MVNVGDTVFVTPVNGQKNYIAVITGPGGAGGAAGEAGGMNSYWTELVAHLKYFSNLERSYVLEPPASIGYKYVIEEVLKTVEFTALPDIHIVLPASFSLYAAVKTRSAIAGEQYQHLGLAIGLSSTKHTAGETLYKYWNPCYYADVDPCIEDGNSGATFVCIAANGWATSFYPCNSFPDFTNETFYLQALVYSRVRWQAGTKPTNCTAYIKDIRVGGTVYYDQGIHILDSGTSTTVTETVITDSSQSWSLHKWVGDTIEISSGSAFGTQAVITASDVTSVTCADATFVTDGMSVGDDFDING